MQSDDDSQLADDFAQLEAILARLRLRSTRSSTLHLAVDKDRPSYAAYAKAMLDARIQLGKFLPGRYFNDPAFDMLLDLFVATETHQKRSFKVSALASRVPAATAARYVEMMVQDGIITREADAQDGRRTLLSLSDTAMEALRGWLASIAPVALERAE